MRESLPVETWRAACLPGLQLGGVALEGRHVIVEEEALIGAIAHGHGHARLVRASGGRGSVRTVHDNVLVGHDHVGGGRELQASVGGAHEGEKEEGDNTGHGGMYVYMYVCTRL